jgi:hypothetical protein
MYTGSKTGDTIPLSISIKKIPKLLAFFSPTKMRCSLADALLA